MLFFNLCEFEIEFEKKLLYLSPAHEDSTREENHRLKISCYRILRNYLTRQRQSNTEIWCDREI
jgi:hypothetical protein